MKKKFISIYLIVISIMLCTYVPFNLMRSNTNKITGAETLIFERSFGHAPIWYTYMEGSQGHGGYVTAINYKQLIIQITFITLAFTIIYLFLPNNKSAKNINTIQ